MKRGQYIAIITILLLLSVIGLFVYGQQVAAAKKQAVVDAQKRIDEAAQEQQRQTENMFARLPLRAKSLYIQNLTTGEILYEKNADTALPLASLTKIMTVVAALDRLDGETPISFSSAAIAQTGDQGFAVGETRTLQDLIPFMLITSSNDAGYAIGETYEQITGTPITDAMQSIAQELRLSTLVFRSATGLDITNSDGSVIGSASGSARDIAKLLVYASQRYPGFFVSSSDAQGNLASHSGQNTNTIVGSTPGFVVSKTGYTTIAQGNIAFIVEIGPNQPYVVVIMGSTFEGRFAAAKQIITALYTVVGEHTNAL